MFQILPRDLKVGQIFVRDQRLTDIEAEKDLTGLRNIHRREGIDVFSGIEHFSGTYILEGTCNRSDLKAVK